MQDNNNNNNYNGGGGLIVNCAQMHNLLEKSKRKDSLFQYV